MVKQLRRKFIFIAMCAVITVLLVITAAINISGYINMSKFSAHLALVIAENNGHFPKPDKSSELRPPMDRGKAFDEAPYSTRFFTVMIDSKGNISTVDTAKVATTSSAQAAEYAKRALSKLFDEGFIDEYRYLRKDTQEATLMVFVDCSRDLEVFYVFLQNSLLVCALGLLAVFILVVLLSDKAVLPIVLSYERQKRFVTDAGHELKTPLSIINANTEVIELENGESEWTLSIKNQVERLSGLVSSFITLTKMDEDSSALNVSVFNISKEAVAAAKNFEAICFTNKTQLHCDIDTDITVLGAKEEIFTLMSVLLDNSVKYTSDANIYFSVKRKGKKCELAVRNKADNLKGENQQILFERFYRPDSSRSIKTGGSGIGLSIARAITLRHKGKISARLKNGYLIVLVTI